jgi:ComF family protein
VPWLDALRLSGGPPLPGLCAVCRRWQAARLCEGCRLRFAAVEPRCDGCGAPLPASASMPATRCGSCVQQRRTVLRRTVVAVRYGFPWDRLIADLKFHGRLDLAPVLAQLLQSRVASDPAHHDVDLVLPVPLSDARLQERGFNQAWELARRVARGVQRPAEPAMLLRLRDTAHQPGLSAQGRRSNLSGAFLVDPRAGQRLQGRRVALVDDVLTTGATADEAAGTLLAAGARDVQLWVVARTPAPGEDR